MDFMKVIDQTVREIKREVNLKVLKVPEIEQKVLDATDNEPWGPHGTALAEIAQATKKFTECQMVMSVLWTRLGETGKDWRYVYKALAVIEYLISHGSERAVDEIIGHTFQISSLTSFEYVEPSGKDMGINVRKKAENLVALLNNRDKIQEVRNKAAANRDKYVGLSSTGMTYKSGAASFGSGRYGSSARNHDSYRDTDYYEDAKSYDEPYGKSRKEVKSDDQGYTTKKSFSRYGSKDQSNTSNASRSSTKPNGFDKYSSVPSKHVDVHSSNDDDFDPRGTSSNKSTTGSSNQVDLFGQSLIGDLLDAPTPGPSETLSENNNNSSAEVDLFGDATFVSASPEETRTRSQNQKEVDLFASVEPASVSATPPAIDLFASPEPVVQPEVKPPKPDSTTTNIVDPFAAVPLNNFHGSDPFGAFTSHSETQNPVSDENTRNLGGTSDPFGAFTSHLESQNPTSNGNKNNLGGVSLTDSKPPSKKDGFQVKSGIWADSLSRGLIDLNITAPKKVSLADVGIMGGLSDGSEEKEKVPPTSFYMGRAMGTGSGLGRTGYTAAPASAGGLGDCFSNLGSQQYQFGSFQK